MSAGFATENSEFVLQTNGVETAGVQEVRGAHVVFDVAVLDLQRDRSGIVIGLTVIGHRHDAGLEIEAGSRYRLLQVRGEGGNPAMAGQRIAHEGDSAERHHPPALAYSLGEGCPYPGRAYRGRYAPRRYRL